jgi:hypothetical protein
VILEIKIWVFFIETLWKLKSGKNKLQKLKGISSWAFFGFNCFQGKVDYNYF